MKRVYLAEPAIFATGAQISMAHYKTCGEASFFWSTLHWMKSGGAPPHSKTWPQFLCANGVCVLESRAAAPLLIRACERQNVC